MSASSARRLAGVVGIALAWEPGRLWVEEDGTPGGISTDDARWLLLEAP